MPRLENGHTLFEVIAALAVLVALFGLGLPWLDAYMAEARLLGAGRQFKTEFLKARSIAVRSNAQAAIRFEQAADGAWFYSTYLDRNRNGVLAADIRRGVDIRIGQPRRLDGGAARRERGHPRQRARPSARHGHARSRAAHPVRQRVHVVVLAAWAPRRRGRSTWPASSSRPPFA